MQLFPMALALYYFNKPTLKEAQAPSIQLCPDQQYNNRGAVINPQNIALGMTGCKNQSLYLGQLSFAPDTRKVLGGRLHIPSPMFLPLLPIALVNLPSRVLHYPEPMLLVIQIGTFIDTAVRPFVDSLTMFEVIFPLSIVHLSVLAFEPEMAVELVVFEFAPVDVASLVQGPLAVAPVIEKLPYIPGIVGIVCLPISVRHIVFPLALILETLFSHIQAIPVCHIVLQISLIVAPVALDEATIALTSPIDEVALQVVIIGEIELPESIGFAVIDFSYVMRRQALDIEFLFGGEDVSNLGSICFVEVLDSRFDILVGDAGVLAAGELVHAREDHGLRHFLRLAQIDRIGIGGRLVEILPRAALLHGGSPRQFVPVPHMVVFAALASRSHLLLFKQFRQISITQLTAGKPIKQDHLFRQKVKLEIVDWKWQSPGPGFLFAFANLQALGILTPPAFFYKMLQSPTPAMFFEMKLVRFDLAKAVPAGWFKYFESSLPIPLSVLYRPAPGFRLSADKDLDLENEYIVLENFLS